MNLVDGVVLAAYLSLAAELTCFPIPSEASTWQLLAGGGGAARGCALEQARSQPFARKLLVFLLPTALCVGWFLLPLAAVLVPAVASLIPRVDSLPLALPGLALVVVGRGATFVSVLQLRAQQRAGGGPPAGLFRWSRNPGLCGMFAFYLGLCCLFPSPVLWVGLPFYVANMHRRVRLEEAHLSARHGNAWRDYEGRVPRYLRWPGLR